METLGVTYKDGMRRRLYGRLLPLLIKINKYFIDPSKDKRFEQIIDFVEKAVEERIDRMSQTERFNSDHTPPKDYLDRLTEGD